MSRENSFLTTDGQFIEELRTIESSNNGTIESSSTFSKDSSQTQTTSLRQIVLRSTESFQKIQNVRFAFNPKHYEKFYDCTVDLKENTADKSLIYYTDKETGEIKSFSTKERYFWQFVNSDVWTKCIRITEGILQKNIMEYLNKLIMQGKVNLFTYVEYLSSNELMKGFVSRGAVRRMNNKGKKKTKLKKETSTYLRLAREFYCQIQQPCLSSVHMTEHKHDEKTVHKMLLNGFDGRDIENYDTEKFHTEDYNTKHCDIEEYNTKHCDTKEYKTEDCNTEDCNTEDCNTENCNTEHCNTVDCITEDCNTRDCNTLDHNTENRETEDHDIEDRNTEEHDVEECKTQDKDTENRETDDHDIEYRNTKNCNTGDCNAQDHDTENRDTDDHDIEDRNTEELDIEECKTKEHDTEDCNTKDRDSEDSSVNFSKVEETKVVQKSTTDVFTSKNTLNNRNDTIVNDRYFLPRINDTFLHECLQGLQNYAISRESITDSQSWLTMREIIIKRIKKKDKH